MMSAFEWHIYDDRRKALEHLKNNLILVDTIIETEDGRAHEPVHSQVMSAFGDKLTQYIQENGVPLIDLSNRDPQQQHALSYIKPPPPPLKAGGLSSQVVHRRRDNNQDSTHHQQTQQQPPQPTVLGQLTHCNTGKLKLVRLPKVNRYTLAILVECAYSGYIRTDLATGGIWQVLEMADFYEMSDVIRACCSFLAKNLNQSNCIYFYHVGIKHKHQLQRAAWHQIRVNFKHILAQNLLDSSNDLAENGILGPNWSGLNASPTPMSIEPGANQPAAGRSSASATAYIRSESQSGSFGSQATRLAAAASALSAPPTSNPTSTPTPSTAAISSPATSSNSNAKQNSNSNSSLVARRNRTLIEAHIKANNLATIKFEHFEPLLLHDKLNIDTEESVWYAIKLWCNHKLSERASLVANLLPCMRFPRFRTGTEFSSRRIWRDPLIINNEQAQHQLAVLDRNHRDFLASGCSNSSGRGGSNGKFLRDGFNLPCAAQPRQLRPRIPNSVLLAIGGWQQGQPTTLIESYDVNCNMWFESKFKISSPLAYHGIEYINNLLYICGGTDGSDILSSLFTFDPIRGDCKTKPPMRDARCYVSTAHLNGYLYALGGHNGSQRMRSVERFELKNEHWAHVQDMNVARSDASACVYNSYIYIAGGLNDQVVESSVEFYNSADNTWTFIQSMLIQRTSFTLLAYQRSLLAVGGNNGQERLNSVEQYDFVTRIWTQHSQMRHKRSTFSAALVDDSKLIVVGGYNGTTPFSQVEMFDEHARQWVSLQKIRYDRSGLKAVVVKDLPNAHEYTFLGSQAATNTTGGPQHQRPYRAISAGSFRTGDFD